MSTPISQLQAAAPDDNGTRVLNEIEHEISGAAVPQGYAQPMYAPQYVHAAGPAVQAPVAPRSSTILGSDEVRIFIVVAIAFALLANGKVVDMIALKIPGMNNPIASLVLRAAIASFLVALALRFAKTI
jgi:hypothetical protein